MLDAQFEAALVYGGEEALENWANDTARAAAHITGAFACIIYFALSWLSFKGITKLTKINVFQRT